MSTKNIVLLFAILTLIMWLCSCSSNYHLKRSLHHLEKAKSKGYVPVADTVYRLDTVRLSGVRLDTFLRDIGDTITLTKDRLKVIYKRDTVTNQIYIEGECLPDTVIRRIPVSVHETVYIEKGIIDNIYGIFSIKSLFGKVIFWILLILGIFIVSVVLRK